jgi:hypothetical protein
VREPLPRIVRDVARWLNCEPAVLAATRPTVDETDKKAFDLLYVVLNALDAKAGTLMRFNGLVSATMVLLLNPALADSLKHRWPFVASFLAAIGAELACFFIFAVNYRFLRHDGDTGRELVALATVAESRQAMFWAAWFLTLGATSVLVVGVLINVAR